MDFPFTKLRGFAQRIGLGRPGATGHGDLAKKDEGGAIPHPSKSLEFSARLAPNEGLILIARFPNLSPDDPQ